MPGVWPHLPTCTVISWSMLLSLTWITAVVFKQVSLILSSSAYSKFLTQQPDSSIFKHFNYNSPLIKTSRVFPSNSEYNLKPLKYSLVSYSTALSFHLLVLESHRLSYYSPDTFKSGYAQQLFYLPKIIFPRSLYDLNFLVSQVSVQWRLYWFSYVKYHFCYTFQYLIECTAIYLFIYYQSSTLDLNSGKAKGVLFGFLSFCWFCYLFF